MDVFAPCVGVFWGEPMDQHGGFRLLRATTPLETAERYGECLTFALGHAEVWTNWRRQRLSAFILANEYDEVPRGRVVYHEPTKAFWIYADRRLRGAAFISDVLLEFGLESQAVDLRSDFHYR